MKKGGLRRAALGEIMEVRRNLVVSLPLGLLSTALSIL
jgi:hypothetical protein